MPNTKTVPTASKPVAQNGWVRKCDVDAYLDCNLPIPTQVVSNEEFIPLPQTAKQHAVEHHLVETATRNAKQLGMDRRQFLRTSCGMAAGFAALNTVFGRFFSVHAAELFDAAAAAEKKIDYFIFDVQTHHVVSGHHTLGQLDFLDARRMAAAWNPALKGRDPQITDLYLENYIKEVFLDSDTSIACISGVPAMEEKDELLPPDKMVCATILSRSLLFTP